MDEQELLITFPLDADGFLRRACPTCREEFKWLPSSPNRDDEEPRSAYWCPYCRASAPVGEWATGAQVDHIRNEVLSRTIGPALGSLGASVRRLSSRSGGLITATLTMSEPTRAPLIFEPNDMRRVEFPCHPSEQLKVANHWPGAVSCLVCGSSVA